MEVDVPLRNNRVVSALVLCASVLRRLESFYRNAECNDKTILNLSK